MVECAMYELTRRSQPSLPGRTGVPRVPGAGRATHSGSGSSPVFGAVSGTVACLGAMEAIKLITGIGEPLAGEMIAMDLRSMRTQVLKTFRDPKCLACGG